MFKKIIMVFLLMYCTCSIATTWKGELHVTPVVQTLVLSYSPMYYQLNATNNKTYDLNIPTYIDLNQLLMNTPAVVDGNLVVLDDPLSHHEAISVTAITFTAPYIVKLPLENKTLLTIQIIPETL